MFLLYVSNPDTTVLDSPEDYYKCKYSILKCSKQQADKKRERQD